MKYKTYGEVQAAVYSINMPKHIDPDTRITRTGTKNFLMNNPPSMYRQGGWLSLWARITWVRETLKRIGVRVPAKAWDFERAQLSALLTGSQPEDAAQAAVYKKALRWTRSR